MKKNDIIIGVHGGHAVHGSRGASGFIDEVECDRWIADEITKYLLENGFRAVNISVDSGSQNEVLNELYKRSRENGTTHNISVHLNACTNEIANGFEIWTPYTWGNCTWQHKAITNISNGFCKHTKQINRGLKYGGSLFVCNNLKNCILPEFAFVTNKKESLLYANEKKCRRKARRFASLYIKHYLNMEIYKGVKK